MKPLPTAVVRRSALAKGFVRGRETDHERYFFEVEGRKTSWLLAISHGANELRLDEMRNTARALKIGAADLFKILSCEHDAQKTLALFHDVFPNSAAPETATGEETKRLRDELAVLTQALQAAKSEEEVQALLPRWDELTAKLNET